MALELSTNLHHFSRTVSDTSKGPCFQFPRRGALVTASFLVSPLHLSTPVPPVTHHSPGVTYYPAFYPTLASFLFLSTNLVQTCHINERKAQTLKAAISQAVIHQHQSCNPRHALALPPLIEMNEMRHTGVMSCPGSYKETP